ncbi:unnamed protein product [Caenorhabditis angaria]|uniref:T-box domain-containing protein n=1 Tax=Caenorhabditis angaria TaxID=860376 RepID=A0A9P1MZ11_9PELO|nr:unnamed protein product [Caenorhabditis angaria]
MFTDFSIDAILSKPEPGCSSMIFGENGIGIGSGNGEDIRIFLQSAGLWRRFHCLGTEMIVTKSGRRMFPTLSIILTGLNPSKNYIIMVDLECVQEKRFRYSFHQSKWVATGPGETELPSRMFVHPDSPASGSHWMRSPISFDKMKLTNNQLDTNGHIIVNSMHKYRPRVHIVEQGNESIRKSFSFNETEFIAVTAYQNHRITSLKIESNPFAKGFRECEVSSSSSSSNSLNPSMNLNLNLENPSNFHQFFPLIYPFIVQNYTK